MMLLDLSKPADTQRSTLSSSKRVMSTYDPTLESRVEPDNSITPPPEIEATDARIDWDAEAGRVASDVVRRMDQGGKLRSFDEQAAGMGPLPPKPSRHELGDGLHLEGGVIIDWVNQRCYYSNQDAHVDAFGPALRLQLPTCTGASAGGRPLPTLEEWKKARDKR
jgi:hypothetical protein